MDHTRDNPLKRFNAFWIALLLVFTFGIGLLLLAPFANDTEDLAYEEKRSERLVVKNKIDLEQEGELDQEALAEAIAKRSKLKGDPTPGSMKAPPAL